ncbi:hypothetical protein [Fischerella sp.]|uniref:hypothetical protein n=1 Tax=Fischerella sp. TaxID=1191 RepID=UPI0025BB69F3|nr:hypothetical protein [Fischerella sp.]
MSICASAKAQLGSKSTKLQEQVKRDLNTDILAQANRRSTYCDRLDTSDTTLYFNTNNQKSVRVFRPRNNPTQILMNIYDSRNQGASAEIASCSPATRISQPYQLIYSTNVKGSIYYATVLINNKSKIQANLKAASQNTKKYCGMNQLLVR